MASLAIYHGVVRGGPHDGKTHAQQGSRQWQLGKDAKGFYAYAPPHGGAPAAWVWIARK